MVAYLLITIVILMIILGFLFKSLSKTMTENGQLKAKIKELENVNKKLHEQAKIDAEPVTVDDAYAGLLSES